jgi:hypothetical protein
VTLEDREHLKRADAMRALLATEGWQYLCDIINAQLATKKTEMERPLESWLDARAESAKGAVLAFRLVLAIPSTMVAEAEQIRKTLRGDEEDI